MSWKVFLKINFMDILSDGNSFGINPQKLSPLKGIISIFMKF
jgi:hypothetical protein